MQSLVCRGMESCKCGWEPVCWTFLSTLSHSRREWRNSRASFTRQWAVHFLQTQHVALSPEIRFWLWFDNGVFGYSPGLTFWKPLLWPSDVMSCVFRQTLWCISCSWSFWVTSVHLGAELNCLLCQQWTFWATIPEKKLSGHEQKLSQGVCVCRDLWTDWNFSSVKRLRFCKFRG